MRRIRIAVAAAVAVLCTVSTDTPVFAEDGPSPSASVSSSASAEPGTDGKQLATARLGDAPKVRLDPANPYGQSWDVTQRQVETPTLSNDAAIARTERESTTPNYYPEDPEDPNEVSRRRVRRTAADLEQLEAALVRLPT